MGIIMLWLLVLIIGLALLSVKMLFRLWELEEELKQLQQRIQPIMNDYIERKAQLTNRTYPD